MTIFNQIYTMNPFDYDYQVIDNFLNENEFSGESVLTLNKNVIGILPERLKLFTWLKTLKVKGCGLDTLDNLPPFLENLDASNNKIIEIAKDQLPITLLYFDISLNDLTSLCLPDQIVSVDASHNKISSFDDTPSCLTEINLCNNKLSKMPKFKEGLIKLEISRNPLESIDDAPQSLVEFDCSMCEIKHIRKLPSKLQSLYAFYNKLEYVMYFPNTLLEADLSNNSLVWIPDYPPIIEKLDISSNELKCLRVNKIPPSLQDFDISGNKLDKSKIDLIAKYGISEFKYDEEIDDNENLNKNTNETWRNTVYNSNNNNGYRNYNYNNKL